LANTVRINETSLTVVMSRETALASLVRESEIPFERIESVIVGPATRLPWHVRRIGMSNLLTGARRRRFWMGGMRIVASYNDP
jgi:hypothetical protein